MSLKDELAKKDAPGTELAKADVNVAELMQSFGD
jgi:hypothetical protein